MRGHFQKVLMHGRVGSQLGMEGSRKNVVFLHKRGPAFVLGENGDSSPDLFDDGTANKDHFEWAILKSGGLEKNVAGELTAVTIAENGHVEQFQGALFRIFDFVRQENRPGAGAENGAAVAGEFADGVVEPFFLEELELRSGFPTRKNEAVTPFQVSDGADFGGFRAEMVEHFGVSLEITLDGEYADFHEHLAFTLRLRLRSFAANNAGQDDNLCCVLAAAPGFGSARCDPIA